MLSGALVVQHRRRIPFQYGRVVAQSLERNASSQTP
jgi:hypothetical protein